MLYTNSKSIAILLAAYNAQDFLAEQLDSILKQTNQDWTLYIRNDGSTDQTQSIIDKYCACYPDKIIQIDKGGKNLGCRNNFFRLLEAVDSTYYAFSDADDKWLEDKIQISLQSIQEAEKQYPSLPVLAFGDTIICDSKMNILEPSLWKSLHINPEKFLSYNYMAICCTAGGSCSIFNKKVKNKLYPLVDNGLMYDYWIALVVSKVGKFKVIHQPLLYYRQHENQVCGVSIGEQNTLKYKLAHIFTLVKRYQREAKILKSAGYGSYVKYYWFKLLTIIKIRMYYGKKNLS